MSTTPTPTPTTIHHFIGGKPYPSQTTEWRDVTNPATQEVVAREPGRGVFPDRFQDPVPIGFRGPQRDRTQCRRVRAFLPSASLRLCVN